MCEHGFILKGVGGFYSVRAKDGQEVVCRARGRFRREGITPLCGDHVRFALQQAGDALIEEILPRRNVLTRPPVANIDQLVIVMSAHEPSPDLLLCDKLLISAAAHDIEPLIVLNKCDMAKTKDTQSFMEQYQPHYSILSLSAKTGEGMDTLSDKLDGKISCFSGQSAVGKSSLLNALLPELDLPVGGLSQKTGRGRHTTRHAQLWPYRSGAVLDTAGFSLLELSFCTQEELNRAYREFGSAPVDCRFAACAHSTEPECAVKELLETGALHQARYERYLEISKQFEEMRKHKYD